MNLQLIAVAVIAALGFGSAWQIQSWRMDAKEKVYAEQKLADQQHAAETALRQSQAVIDAQSAATARIAALRRDADGARTALLGLSDATDAAMRSAETSHNACLDRASTLGQLLGAMATVGGEIAAKADRHSSDSQTLTEAWPK
jgi:hypothetical protein